MRRRFDLGGRPGLLAGMGVEAWRTRGPAGVPHAPRRSTSPTRSTRAASTPARAARRCWRITSATGARRPTRSTCVLIGRLAMPEPRQPGVRYLGFLAEDEKASSTRRCARRRLPEPLREPVDRAARGPRARTRPASSTRAPRCCRTRAALGRCPLLRRRRRVRRVDRPRRARRLPARGARPRAGVATWRPNTAGTSCSTAGAS